MGFRVASYSVNELHRISVPSAVPPSLFWVLPIGDWPAHSLDQVWRWFTEQQSKCKDYGLLLVKESGRTKPIGSDVSLASIGAELSDVMPAGAKQFVSPSAFDPGSRSVLVLSGGYPQPGWGLLVEWPQDVRNFESCIKLALSRLSKQSGLDIGVFAEAASSFHRWKDPKDEPKQPDLTPLERSIAEAEKMLSAARNSLAAITTFDYRAAAQRLSELTDGSGILSQSNNPVPNLQSLSELHIRLKAAFEITSVSAETITSEIEPQLARLTADPSRKAEVYKQIAHESVKRALSACNRVRQRLGIAPGEGFHAWAQQELIQIQSQLVTDVAPVELHLVEKQIRLRGELSQLKRDYELKQVSWRGKSKENREAFHHLSGRAAELQWELGPAFLVTLEDVCRESEIGVQSIPWDPARMIGWKIMARNVSLGSLDLISAARELSLTGANEIPGNGSVTGRADGSYFTDYVHYIAMTKPGTSPRAVTRDLVAHLLRPSEMRTVIQLYGGKDSASDDTESLADALLESCGWRFSDESRERPLARFLHTDIHGKATLAEGNSGNDLRIALESFCKDVLDVMITQLGYTHDEIWQAIDERVPRYQPSSRTRDWSEEVGQMTVGAASLLLPAFGSLAFSTRQKEFDELIDGLGKLARVLNKCSHHHQESPLSEGHDEVPGLLRNVLDKALELLGDLPWHLHAMFSYGEQPKVVSGEAWSHGSATPRLLRVITWSDTPLGARILFWNKNRRNPIVTDPVFVLRPRRGLGPVK